jgi:hypothetical protein
MAAARLAYAVVSAMRTFDFAQTHHLQCARHARNDIDENRTPRAERGPQAPCALKRLETIEPREP